MDEKKKKLINEWLKLKKTEDQAYDKRIKIESQLETMLGVNFDGTSKTFKEDDFSIVIKKNVVFKLDQEKYKSIRENIPEELRPEKIKFDLDMEGYKYLKEKEKDIYKIVANCVEKKNNKNTFTITKK